MNKGNLKSIVIALVLIVLASMILTSLPVQKALAVPSITSISPSSGYVGASVQLNGTIDTLDGNFTIRWNNTTNVASGKAVGNNVAATFIVPLTVGAPAPLGRNVTVELIDVSLGTNNTATTIFKLLTKFEMQVTTLPPPRQIMEGMSASILVNVTGGERDKVYMANLTVQDPVLQTYSKLIPLSNTTTNGAGSASISYPSIQFGAGTHTNYTGQYSVWFNKTQSLAQGSFFVGLTDKTEYQRGEAVQVQAAGYRPSQPANVYIKTGSLSVAAFPNTTARTDGMVSVSWTIPQNATPGTYTVSVTNATVGGTVKFVSDTQSFQVVGIICQVKVENLAGEVVPGASVEVYNSTSSTVLASGNANSTGGLKFNLKGGYYTFKALWKGVQVFSLVNESVIVDSSLSFMLQLTDLRVAVRDANGALPFVNLSLAYNYTTRANQTKSESVSFTTDLTGSAETGNLFVNLNYSLKASRYDLTLPGTPPINKTSSVPLNTVTITVPTYTALVTVVDSSSAPASSIQIAAYEWSSGTVEPAQVQTSDSQGQAALTLPFGKYRLIAFDDSLEINQTTLNLVQNNLNFTFNLNTLNVDFKVSVRDFFGQPIANANVTVERKIGDNFVRTSSQNTGANGIASFSSTVGGDTRVSVYVGGHLVGAETVFLSGTQSSFTFQVPSFVVIFGNPIDAGLFALLIFIIILIVGVLVLLRGRLLGAFRRKDKS